MLIAEYNAQTEEWVSLLHHLYERSSTESVPSLDRLYKIFQQEWVKLTTEFLLINKDAWEITDEEVLSIEDNFQQLGFVCPTYKQMQEVLEIDSLSHQTYDGQFVRMAVSSVW